MMATRIDPEALALQRLYHWEKTAPDRVALTQPQGGGVVRDYTWREVVDQARRMAAHLQSLGLQPGDKVALLSKNTAHWMMSDFAIWLGGFVSVPLYPTLAAGTIRQILEHSESKVLFVGKLDGWAGMKPGVPAKLPCISLPLAPDDAVKSYPSWDDITARTAPLAGHPVRPADELATLMYTSGTTGAPKGVMHSFGAFAAALSFGLKRVPLNEQSRMLSYLPLSHVVERALVEHGLLATSMHVYFAESLETFTADLQRARPTVFFSVPRLWVKFQQGINTKMPPAKLNLMLKIPILGGIVRRKILGALGLQECTFAAGGAAPMPLELLHWYARLGINIAEGYGMTENIGATHISDGNPTGFGTVGRPYDSVQCRIDATTGEVQIASPANMLGYYKEPAMSREAFTEDGWLKTGDKGAVDAQGRLKITGRVKDLFKTSKGKYVAPAPIEDRLVMHGALEACCVTGANLGQPLALAMLNIDAIKKAAQPAGRAELESSLAAHVKVINETLDPHEQLDCLVVTAEAWTVDNDLITPTFKVKRNRIEDLFAKNYDAWVEERKTVIWYKA
ncbi:Long-chain-fatty-acid--CoA ligase [Rubrivivax sp. A210]|uniref:AMP-binding protein n=1 Tax=Rubrivivax sp. A210 TaxID=2772301 RepID=UPI0019BBEA07|nr:AMP-binding protein [Rubrivivax sp. A210]CAD5373411.1 Long-chain-fatty-acid--CoA ligase [Rubrivivax sp. A210]